MQQLLNRKNSEEQDRMPTLHEAGGVQSLENKQEEIYRDFIVGEDKNDFTLTPAEERAVSLVLNNEDLDNLDLGERILLWYYRFPFSHVLLSPDRAQI